jgi:adenylyltransferase/sulfurtransferase
MDQVNANPAPTDSQFACYERQIGLPEIGLTGQRRLRDSRVLVIGAGGLGSAVLTALAGAGVGHLTLVDYDCVDVSNLNRQFLYSAADIGRPKAEAARERLLACHPDLTVTALAEIFTEELARRLIPAQDLVIAAVDNQPARRLINRVCYRQGKIWIDGGIRGFSGAVAVYVPGQTPCYECRYDRPAAGEGAASAPVAALGATASVIGSLEADLALCLLLGLPEPLQGDILYYHGRTLLFQRIRILARPDCAICGDPAATTERKAREEEDAPRR